MVSYLWSKTNVHSFKNQEKAITSSTLINKFADCFAERFLTMSDWISLRLKASSLRPNLTWFSFSINLWVVLRVSYARIKCTFYIFRIQHNVFLRSLGVCFLCRFARLFYCTNEIIFKKITKPFHFFVICDIGIPTLSFFGNNITFPYKISSRKYSYACTQDI